MDATTKTVKESASVHQEDIDLMAIALKLWEKKFVVLIFAFISMLLGLAFNWIAEPVYESNALIQVEKKNRGVPGMGDLTEMFGVTSGSAAELELIKSRQVIGTVVTKLSLQLEVRPKYLPIIGEPMARRYHTLSDAPASPFLGFDNYAWGGESIKIDSFIPPTSTTSTGKRYILKAGKNEHFSLATVAGEEILTGVINKEVSNLGYQIFVSELIARPGTEFEINYAAGLNTVLRYQGMLSTLEKGRDTGIIALTINDTSPERAVAILDSVAESYLRQNVDRQSAEAAKSLEFLRNQLPQIKLSLEQSEEKLNDYKVTVGSIDIGAEANSLLKQIVGVESSLAKMQLQRADLDRKYTYDHPAYEAWRAQVAELNNSKEEFDKRIKGLPSTQQEMLGLQRDVQVGTQIYTQMLNNIQELDIVRAGTVGNVRIIDRAVVNIQSPVQPQKTLILAASIVFGGLLGAVFILISAALNRGVENPDDIEAVGLPVYASIPLSDEQRKLDFGSRRPRSAGQLRKMRNQHPTALLAQRNPTDITIEALRSLRTSLHFAMMEATNNIMMISGPSPNVGKSFVSGNLAAVIAQAGQRVLLIDMDLRKGYMHKMFDIGPENGVSDVLCKRVQLQDAIQPTKIGELFILPRGAIPPNPSELLMSKGLSQLLETVSADYDLIIVDTPPIMAVTDAAIIGRLCGVTMLVTRFGLNPVKELEVTKQRFEQNGINVKGVVLNAVERKASGYGYGYGYGYRYGYYQYDYKSDKN
jgi:tyrosine-protein kinase Etk/Wzc